MNEIPTEALTLILVVLLLFAGLLGSGSGRRSSGVIVKPRAKNPKPKVAPAPQGIPRKNKKK